MKSMFVVLMASLIAVAAWADNAGDFAPLTEVKIADGREMVATAEGRAVYTFDVDRGNVSGCYDACAKAWPPVTVASANGLKDPMGVTTRKDGTLQLTVDGKPVYLYIGDEKSGDIEGDGLHGVWHIIVD
jgi:predicted lipoprotein with Yx(FWY)xxD motif